MRCSSIFFVAQWSQILRSSPPTFDFTLRRHYKGGPNVYYIYSIYKMGLVGNPIHNFMSRADFLAKRTYLHIEHVIRSLEQIFDFKLTSSTS